jgi:hypothetical protein
LERSGKSMTEDRGPKTEGPATAPSVVGHPSPVVQVKRCPRCEETKPLSEFGICNARPDKLNLYCKKCIREKIALQRQSLREYRARNKGANPSPPPSNQIAAGFSPRRIARLLRKLTPSDRVREAIRMGARTQKEITHVTRLPEDEVGDSICNLLLWTREIRTQVISHTRMYFVNDSDTAVPRQEPIRPREPRSFGVSTIYLEGEAEEKHGRRFVA